MNDDQEMPVEEAIALGKEIGEALGGKQKQAIDRLVRIAERAKRPSSTALKAVEHFRAASDIMKDGKG